MKRDKLKPIELECNMGKDINGVEHREPWKAYDIDEVDALLAKKDKEIAELKQKLEDVNELIKIARKILEDTNVTHYTESADAGMRERILRRALYKACANWARAEHVRYVYISDGSQGYKKKAQERWEKMASKCRAKAEEYK